MRAKVQLVGQLGEVDRCSCAVLRFVEVTGMSEQLRPRDERLGESLPIRGPRVPLGDGGPLVGLFEAAELAENVGELGCLCREMEPAAARDECFAGGSE